MGLSVTGAAIIGGSALAFGSSAVALTALADATDMPGVGMPGGDWIKFLANAGSLGAFVGFAGMLLWFQWRSRKDEIAAAEKKDAEWRAFCKTLVDDARRDVVNCATLAETNRQRGHETIREVTNQLVEFRLTLTRINDKLEAMECSGAGGS